MKRIHGKEVFSSLEELLAPDHTALVVIDVQNDFCTPGGHFDRNGKKLDLVLEMLPRLREFLGEARRLGLFVVHLQQTTLPNGLSDSPAWLYLKTRDGKDPDYTLEGSWGHAFVEGFGPREGEVVVRKHRSSGFVNTTLPTVLTARGIRTIVCAGVVTQGCVESTARDAAFYDFHSAVVSDCVASTSAQLHEASLVVQAVRHEVLSAELVLSLWRAARPR